jgi:VanZ family protein
MAQRRDTLAFVVLAYWIPVAAYFWVIWSLSARPNLVPPDILFTGDKVYHFLEYFGLGLLLTRAFRATLPGRQLGPVVWLSMVCGVLIGASDEYHQSFVPGRDMNGYDLLADAAGLLAAQLFYHRFGRG